MNIFCNVFVAISVYWPFHKLALTVSSFEHYYLRVKTITCLIHSGDCNGSEGWTRGISVTCDWAFLKSVICEKAENKSVTCDRGIVCDLWWPNKKTLWSVNLQNSVTCDFHILCAILCDCDWSIWKVIDFESLWFVTRSHSRYLAPPSLPNPRL